MYQLAPVRCMGGKQLEELAQFLRHDAGPAFADVPVERERLVLGEDEDPAQAGVDAVGERDVDDAVVSAKGHGRFGAIAGQRKEPFAGSARKQYSERVFHVRMSLPCRVVFPELPQRESNVPLSGTAFFNDGSFRSALNGEEYHTEITRAACPRYTG